MNRVMLDIETLSTDKHAAVLSIGLVKFDPAQGVTHSQGWAIDMGRLTGHIDPKTVQWWMGNDEAAREFSFKGEANPLSVTFDLHGLLAEADEVWANDPDFDCVILQHWWQRTSTLSWPVPFWKYRSCRTVKALAKGMGVSDIIASTHVGMTTHNPVEDAAKQAREVCAFLKILKVA